VRTQENEKGIKKNENRGEGNRGAEDEKYGNECIRKKERTRNVKRRYTDR
jgi:hypothetical protein